MEIPVVNRIIVLEANINPFHNPSLLSQISVSGIGKAYQTYNLWKWGALILALIASIPAIINKIKILIIRLQNYQTVTSRQYLVDEDDEYESETESSCSVSDDEEEEEEWEDEEVEEEFATTSFYGDEDFRVRGSGYVYIDEQWQKSNLGLGLGRRRSPRSIGGLFSWSELTSGKSLVKLWDNLGLGLGLNVEESSVNEFTIYDMNNDREIRKITSIFGRRDEIPAFVSSSSSSPAVILSAPTTDSGRVALSGWDTRIGSKLPMILAEWRPKLGSTVGFKAGGIEKVYVRDHVSNALTVGDMRKVNMPLDDPIETDVDGWWDADAVIVTEDCFHDSN